MILSQQLFRLTTRFIICGLAFVCAVLGAARPVAAATASADAVLKAIAEASAAGLCTERSQSYGTDCTKTTVDCGGKNSNGGWKEYVTTHYGNIAGSIQLGGSRVTGATKLQPYTGTVTTALSNKAVQILRDHKAGQPQCQAQCPTDMSVCGIGKEYPFVLDGASYVGQIQVHTNAPGQAAGTSGCPHPGVGLLISSTPAIAASTGNGGAADYLRAEWQRNSVTPPGPIQRGTCYCQCAGNEDSGVCQGKASGFPFKKGDNLTYNECSAACSPFQVAPQKCFVQSIGPSAATAGAVSSPFDADAFCFTPAECQQQDGIFEEYTDCRDKGRCIAKEPLVTLNQPLGNVSQVRGFSQYVVTAYRYLLSIVAVVATIAFVWGAFLFLLGSAMPSISKGRQIMVDAVIGLILVLSATAILRTINPATTNLSPLKVYLVNGQQFVNVAYCADLGSNIRTALAGVRPGLESYDSVAKDPKRFSIPADKTLCGNAYWVENAAGSACDGNLCQKPGESCLSCADSSLPGCSGHSSDRSVCAPSIFTGMIDYIDGRYPTGLDLLAVCNWAQDASLNPDNVVANIALIKGSIKPQRVGRSTQSKTTDKDEVGRATYRFEFTEQEIKDAVANCKDKGGFRGALLGLVYKESGSAVGVAIDDVAVLSRKNCSRSPFDGYANGGTSDTTDEAEAIVCGLKRSKFLDGNDIYWKQADLTAAAQGNRPITCNFGLSNDNAPDDPADKFCSGKK